MTLLTTFFQNLDNGTIFLSATSLGSGQANGAGTFSTLIAAQSFGASPARAAFFSSASLAAQSFGASTARAGQSNRANLFARSLGASRSLSINVSSAFLSGITTGASRGQTQAGFSLRLTGYSIGASQARATQRNTLSIVSIAKGQSTARGGIKEARLTQPSPDRTLYLTATGLQFLQWPIAEPDDSLDYNLDLTAVMSATSDVIESVSISAAPSGSGELVLSNAYVGGYLIEFFASGGVAGRLYAILINVVTGAGREYSWLANIAIDPTYAIPPIPIAPNPGFGTAITASQTVNYSPPTPVEEILPIGSSDSASRTVILYSNGSEFLQWPVSEPGNSLDYYFDASCVLAFDPAVSGSVSVKPSGAGELVINAANGSSSGLIRLEISGGVPSRAYVVKIDIVTTTGRVYSWLVTLPIDSTYTIPPIPIAPSPDFGPTTKIIIGAIELESGFGNWQLEDGSGDWLWG